MGETERGTTGKTPPVIIRGCFAKAGNLGGPLSSNYLGMGRGERLTTTLVEILPAEVPLPMYTACTLCTPALSWLFQLAWPPVKVSTGPSCWFPSSRTTESPSLLPVTLITKFALCGTPFAKPKKMGTVLPLFTVSVVLLGFPAAITTWVKAKEVLAAKVLSPL